MFTDWVVLGEKITQKTLSFAGAFIPGWLGEIFFEFSMIAFVLFFFIYRFYSVNRYFNPSETDEEDHELNL